MRSHDSADPPNAADRRIAISALMAARPLITRESATRETPSLRAKSLTLSSARTVSRRTSPGCGGLCILLIGPPFSDSPRNPRVSRSLKKL